MRKGEDKDEVEESVKRREDERRVRKWGLGEVRMNKRQGRCCE